MLRDYVLPITDPSVYAVHRQVYDLLGADARPLFMPLANTVVVRTASDLTDSALHVREVPSIENGQVVHVLLRASVETKCKGRRSYPSPHAIAPRRDWLARRASSAGLRVIGEPQVHPGREYVDKPDDGWWMDATVFVFDAEVVDADAFRAAAESGIGRTGKAFGFSMPVFNVVASGDVE